RLLTLGCSLLGLWLLLLIANALDWTQAPLLANRLLQIGAALSLLGVAMGCTLDYLALRRTRLA
ncbi:muropeptide transporter AmpG, partial [Klebsiella pneumoniae]|nr:muropeptide transporter AmpG [Klebsiella pneumoniae]